MLSIKEICEILSTVCDIDKLRKRCNDNKSLLSAELLGVCLEDIADSNYEEGYNNAGEYYLNCQDIE
jgi:hypothetical protein